MPVNKERWTFGLDPLPSTLAATPTLRRIAGLFMSLDSEDPALDALVEQLRSVERSLVERSPADTTPRLGVGAPAGQRPYLDHSRHVGAYDPCFPEYEITAQGDQATGTVTFPLAFEGPPGVVHGGVQATFFDCVVQHHNCDVGVAGKTTSLLVEYHRPTPIEVPLAFDILRQADGRRITSTARLTLDDDVLSTATMQAVAGVRAQLPHVPARQAQR